MKTNLNIRAIIFDLDNTLVDFMLMKQQAVDAAIRAMIDAGLGLRVKTARDRIDAIYKERGIEFQNVFDQLLYDEFNKVDFKILSAGIIAYRRAREAALVPPLRGFGFLRDLRELGHDDQQSPEEDHAALVHRFVPQPAEVHRVAVRRPIRELGVPRAWSRTRRADRFDLRSGGRASRLSRGCRHR
jgi:phosphoglycolate phosphatase-like HAD superfamily hydrolase